MSGKYFVNVYAVDSHSTHVYDEIEHGLTLNVRGGLVQGIDGFFDIEGDWTLRGAHGRPGEVGPGGGSPQAARAPPGTHGRGYASVALDAIERAGTPAAPVRLGRRPARRRDDRPTWPPGRLGRGSDRMS